MSPAIGAGGRLPRRVLVRRQAFAAALVLLLIGAKVLIAPDVIDAATVTPPDRVVTPGLMIGSAPADSDLVEFAVGLQVDGVVNLAAPSVAEQVTAASLHQAYLYLPVPPGLAPTPPQLRRLAGFVRRYTERGAWVYVHDDVGGTRAVTRRGHAAPAARPDLGRGVRGGHPAGAQVAGRAPAAGPGTAEVSPSPGRPVTAGEPSTTLRKGVAA